MSEPDWASASPQQIQQTYTTAGLATYNYLMWGAKKLQDEAGAAWPALNLGPAIEQLTRNYYAARAHWRRGEKLQAAQLMYRTGQLGLQLHTRIMELASREPDLLRRINALGLRGYANRVAAAIDATAETASNIGSGLTTILGLGLALGLLLVLK